MTISLYRGQVDRHTKEIADLERKVADERTRATKVRGDALRKSNSIGKRASGTTLESKLRDIQRVEEKSAQHERRAADYTAQIARKQSSLTSAQKSLERALAFAGEQRGYVQMIARGVKEQGLDVFYDGDETSSSG